MNFMWSMGRNKILCENQRRSSRLVLRTQVFGEVVRGSYLSHPFYPKRVIGREESITLIRSSRFFDDLIDPIRQVLEKHGATLEVLPDSCMLHLPEGTVKQALYPTVRTSRYEITLPDGYKLYTYDSLNFAGYSVIRFVIDEFPEWVQQKYSEPESGKA